MSTAYEYDEIKELPHGVTLHMMRTVKRRRDGREYEVLQPVSKTVPALVIDSPRGDFIPLYDAFRLETGRRGPVIPGKIEKLRVICKAHQNGTEIWFELGAHDGEMETEIARMIAWCKDKGLAAHREMRVTDVLSRDQW